MSGMFTKIRITGCLVLGGFASRETVQRKLCSEGQSDAADVVDAAIMAAEGNGSYTSFTLTFDRCSVECRWD